MIGLSACLISCRLFRFSEFVLLCTLDLERFRLVCCLDIGTTVLFNIEYA